MTDNDDGLTLVELIVYIMLLSIVAAIAAGMFISGLRTSEKTNSLSQSATQGQALVTEIQRDVRNAVALKGPYTEGIAGSSEDVQIFVVEMLPNSVEIDPTQCAAWFYTPEAGGNLFTRVWTEGAGSVTDFLPGPSYFNGLSEASPHAPTGWRFSIEGVNRDGTHPFERKSEAINVTLNVGPADATPVKVDGSVTNRQSDKLKDTSTCF